MSILFLLSLLCLYMVRESYGQVKDASLVSDHILPTLWTLGSSDRSNNRKLGSIIFRNRRLTSIPFIEQNVVTISSSIRQSLIPGKSFSFQLPVSSISNISDKGRSGGFNQLSVLNKTCILKSGLPVIPQGLASKYPELGFFRCVTADGDVLSMVVDSADGKLDGFSAEYFGGDRSSYYIDSVEKGTDQYVIYNTKIARMFGTPPEDFLRNETVFDNSAERPTLSKNLRTQSRSATSTLKAFKLKIAVVANLQYSAYFGDTLSSTLAAVTTVFNRVNGIYQQELGTYFQFIDNMDKLFCISSTADSACKNLGNTVNVINQISSFISTKGFSSAKYDLGHAVTTGSGGLAAYPAMCTSNRARATTGLSKPVADVFYVDYVSHEIGHQVDGPHVFKDCEGATDGNFMTVGAVEPGSGSSIMGYAGICGTNDLQDNSDPYFNGLNLRQMRTYIESSSCGTTYTFTRELPTLTVASCSVPLGNKFRLSGLSTSTNVANSYFTWERIDTGYEDYDSNTSGQIRSWRPTHSLSRFIPNLYYLNFGSEKAETLPAVAKTMTFQFTERSLYNNSVLASEIDVDLMGDFTYATQNVTFVSRTPLTLTSPLSGGTLNAYDTVKVTWKRSDIGSIVKVYIAKMILERVANFRYDLNVVDFDWIFLGEASMESEMFDAVIPPLDSGMKANLMIVSSSTTSADTWELCNFFDIATDITLLNPVTSAPSKFPTKMPSDFPSYSPTQSPVPISTIFPSKSPSKAPTTNSPTKFTTSLSPTPSASTNFPSRSPTTFPTDFPTIYNTDFPTLTPTSFPTQFPSQ